MNPIPLIDADILRYEVSGGGQFIAVDGEEVVLPFERVANALDEKIQFICDEVDTDKKPILYLTPSQSLYNILYRWELTQDDIELPECKLNYRIERATVKPYKGNRDPNKPKPFHFNNLLLYMLTTYECIIAWGMEADDKLCVDQATFTKLYGKDYSVICTRDKDLRMMYGWHYGWECGLQPEFPLTYVEGRGEITAKTKTNKKTNKVSVTEIKGYGTMFFFAQLITGDKTDNIPGCEGAGAGKAWEVLGEVTGRTKALKAVVDIYKKKYKNDWKVRMQEQADLLWMARKVDDDGNPVMWKGIENYD